jgi:membrane protease YdiL (CAAX protease family)
MTAKVARSSPEEQRGIFYAAAGYGVVLVCFWMLLRVVSLRAPIDHVASTFTVFALLFAPMWFFGFGIAPVCRTFFARPVSRILAPILLIIPYLIYALPRGEFHWTFAVVLLLIGVGSSALFECFTLSGSPLSSALQWQDVVVLLGVGLPLEFGWFHRAFPHPGLDAFPKLMMVDIALYAFLVIRQVEGVGYDLRFRVRDLAVGVRELALFAPIVVSLGILLRFITPHGGLPRISDTFVALLLTFFWIAIPEELFFRGLLQNMLEPRLGRAGSLSLSAFIFGLSHFNKPGPFNWRYVLLATIAGIFYGRAWRDRRRILASATTHTLVDVLWVLWFRH